MIASSFGDPTPQHHVRRRRVRKRRWYEGLLPWTNPDALNPPGVESGPDALLPPTPPPDPDALIPPSMHGFGASGGPSLLVVGLGFVAGAGAIVTGVMLGKR